MSGYLALGVRQTLDGQAGLPDRLGKRAYVTVITVSAAVEYGFGYARRLGARRQRLAGTPGALGLGQRAELRLKPSHRRERVAGRVVHQLRAQAPVRAKH